MDKISLTLRQATERSGISRSSLYKVFNQGALLPRKRGKSLLILAEELDAFVLSLPTRPPRPASLQK